MKNSVRDESQAIDIANRFIESEESNRMKLLSVWGKVRNIYRFLYAKEYLHHWLVVFFVQIEGDRLVADDEWHSSIDNPRREILIKKINGTPTWTKEYEALYELFPEDDEL